VQILHHSLALALATSMVSGLVSGPATASLVVTRYDSVAAGRADFGASSALLTWRNVFSGPAAWTGGTFGGASVIAFSATDTATGSIASSRSGSLYVTNWLDGPGFSAGAAATPELAVSGEEDFLLTFAHPVTHIGFAVSTGIGLLPSEVSNTGSAFDLDTDVTSAGNFVLPDAGAGGTYWIDIRSLEPFRTLQVTENPLAGDGIADQYFGDIIQGSVPEPANWALMIAGFGLIGAALRRARWLQPTGLSLALLAAPGTAGAATLALDTHILPSAQGWSFNGVGEAAIFSASSAGLHQDSLGRGFTGSSGGYYTRAVAFGPTSDFSLTMVARISGTESDTTQGTDSYPYGFSFGVASPSRYDYIGLGGARIGATLGGVSYFDFPPGYDPHAYNSYRLTSTAGLVTLKINGAAAFSGVEFDPGPGSFLLFGDGTFHANAQGDIRSLVFNSGTPEPGNWALMIAGFGLVGAAQRRRRSVAA
jgi:hypothetical protein